MKIGKLFFLMVIFSAVICLSACDQEPVPETEAAETAVDEQDPELRLTIATSGSWSNVSRGVLFEEYSEKLKEWTNGEIVIELFDDSALGDDLQLLEGVKLGTLNLINCVPSYLTSAVPEAALLDIPTMFDSIDEFNTFMQGGYFDVMGQYFQDRGLKLISCRAYDMRQMTSNVRIESVEDLEGLKLRTMEVDHQIVFWQSLGAMTIPLPFSQVKLALQLGSIDAQENPLYYLESIRLNTVQDYVILTNHLPMVSTYVMNLDQWEAMTEEQREYLERFITEMEQKLIRETEKQNRQILEDADELNFEVIQTDGIFREALKEGKNAVLEMLRTKLGDAVVDQYLDAVAGAKTEIE